MYKEVNVELARQGMSKKTLSEKTLSEKTRIRYQTLLEKLLGRYPITFDECLAIKNALNTTLSLEELFST